MLEQRLVAKSKTGDDNLKDLGPRGPAVLALDLFTIDLRDHWGGDHAFMWVGTGLCSKQKSHQGHAEHGCHIFFVGPDGCCQSLSGWPSVSLVRFVFYNTLHGQKAHSLEQTRNTEHGCHRAGCCAEAGPCLLVMPLC